MYYGNNSITGAQIFGVDNSYFSTNGLVLKKRTQLSWTAISAPSASVTVIDSGTADSLFDGEDPIGKTIEINQLPFTVIGIVEEDSKFEPVINSIEEYYTYYANQSAARCSSRAPCGPPSIPSTSRRTSRSAFPDTEAMTDAGKAVADILNARILETTGIQYQAQDLLKQAESCRTSATPRTAS